MVKNSNLTWGGDLYLAPSVEIAEFSVERGFAVSGIGSAGWEDGSEENNVGNF